MNLKTLFPLNNNMSARSAILGSGDEMNSEHAGHVPDPALLPEPILVARLFGTRTKSTACIPCRRLKQKCDSVLPCTRCIRNGRADNCKIEDADPMFVERPISLNTHFLRFDTGNVLPPRILKKDWSYDAIVRLWSMGYRFQILEKFFDSIPSHLRSSMKTALHLMQDAQTQIPMPRGHKTITHQAATPLLPVPLNAEALGEPMLKDGAHWETQHEYGFFQVLCHNSWCGAARLYLMTKAKSMQRHIASAHPPTQVRVRARAIRPAPPLPRHAGGLPPGLWGGESRSPRAITQRTKRYTNQALHNNFFLHKPSATQQQISQPPPRSQPAAPRPRGRWPSTRRRSGG
jgi:hypothetical protein